MSKVKQNWANTEHYNKVYNHLEVNKLNVENTHYYRELLEKNGLRVYMNDLKDWLEAKTSVVNQGEFEL
jgi:hypothetical protein